MKHIELAEKYFEKYGRSMIEDDFPEITDRYAAGLVGEGSGCFGFDDEITQDHDFGPGFCIWLNDEDFARYGTQLQAAYDSLPSEFEGFSRSNILDTARVGVMSASDFYESFTGCRTIPSSNMDWFLISEANLAAVTNGKIFDDKLGEFTRIRQGLMQFYPRDVLLKKLAARAAVISQSGQYNYGRCLKRGDKVAAGLALAHFCEAAVSMIYLLHGRPAPFYKWAYHGIKDFYENHKRFEEIMTCKNNVETQHKIELICADLCSMMEEKKLIQPVGSNFLQDYVTQLMSQIEDAELAAMHPMADVAI